MPFSPDEWDALKAMYDAEIAYADEFVGTPFNYVQRVTTGETVFVVTGDHGDPFGEQGVLGHDLVLGDNLTNVLMIVSAMDGLEDARESGENEATYTEAMEQQLADLGYL